MLWAYLFWSQYLVIWYGDLPEETAFVAHRTIDAPWAPLAWMVLGTAFVIPFLMLLSRELKQHRFGLSIVAAIALVGMWFERFILVGPSLWKGDQLPIGPMEILVTAGVAALFALCYTGFLQRVPLLPTADPLLVRARAGH
jgi:Ni/Fe-hydrogenase subunit HybB-like protein